MPDLPILTPNIVDMVDITDFDSPYDIDAKNH